MRIKSRPHYLQDIRLAEYFYDKEDDTKEQTKVETDKFKLKKEHLHIKLGPG